MRLEKGFYGWSSGEGQKMNVEIKIREAVQKAEAEAKLEVKVLENPPKETTLGLPTVSADVRQLKAILREDPDIYAHLSKHVGGENPCANITPACALLNVCKTSTIQQRVHHQASTHASTPLCNQRNKPDEPLILKIEMHVKGESKTVELIVKVTFSLTFKQPLAPAEDGGDGIHTLKLHAKIGPRGANSYMLHNAPGGVLPREGQNRIEAGPMPIPRCAYGIHSDV